MKHLFVPYELALLAKEKGFNEPCMKGIKDGEEFTTCGFNLTNNGNSHDYTLPLYQQLVDWFREKHKIYIVIDLSILSHKYTVHGPMGHELKINTHAGSYYEALNTAITKAFEVI